ncbi:MAG: PA3496 family putative envelope integrity protein [Gammaproteobacteria bacterium]
MAGSTTDVLSDDMDYEDDEGSIEDSEGLISEKKTISNYDKVDARRKIELYWEKRRLKEEFGDIDDFDLDF